MKLIHSQEKEQFRELFKQENIDRIDDRFLVLEVFLQNEHHLTVDDLCRLLRAAGHPFDTAFVEDTLERMCHFGFARKNRFNNGTFRFEHRHLGQHHDHMICTKCGKIIEFHDSEIESAQSRIARAHGFHMLQHRMEIYGICNGCMKDRAGQSLLVSAPKGERLKIVEISGGAGARLRLMSMGLRVGDVVDVISNISNGQVVVSTGDRRFVIGQGLSRKIRVAQVTEEFKPMLHDIPQTDGQDMPLSRMREGQKGIIVRVGGNGALRRRLLEMGLNKGTEVLIEKYAPLKDPMELIVKGYHVSLRVEEANQIVVSNVQ